MLIYRATNKLSNKSYVGLTSKTLAERRSRHYIDARGPSQARFYKALRKYKKEDWTWEVLAECETWEKANELEIEMIAEHNTFNNGYNSTTGGQEAYPKKERKLSDLQGIQINGVEVSVHEYRRSDSYRKNMSKSKKQFYESEKGQKLRQIKSEKMKEFWASEEGQKRKEEFRQKCGRPQSEAKKQVDRERMKNIWAKKGAKAFNR